MRAYDMVWVFVEYSFICCQSKYLHPRCELRASEGDNLLMARWRLPDTGEGLQAYITDRVDLCLVPFGRSIRVLSHATARLVKT